MNRHVNTISNRLSLRAPQRDSLEILARICDILSLEKDGDIVLDSFLGSGTTAAVAHKMGRRWIGIELGEHCHTHCIQRLNSVIEGGDQTGISKGVNWQGGGFRYYCLAPTLTVEDEWGHDDYSLEIKNLPKAPERPVEEVEEKPKKKRTKEQRRQEATLFEVQVAGEKGGRR